MASIASITTPADVLEVTKGFTNEQRYEMAMNLLTALGGWLGKGRKGRKLKDPNVPKREVKADSYVSFVNNYVLPHLVTLSEKPGVDEADGKQLKSASCRTQVGSVLWADVKDSEDRIAAFESITLKTVQTAYEDWKANPPAPKPKKETGKKKVDATSDAEETPTKPKRVTKKRAEAAAAAPVIAPPAVAEEEMEEVPVKLIEWEHDFGKGAQKYKRLDYEGMTYIYDNVTRDYMGAYIEKTNKLKKTVADPLA